MMKLSRMVLAAAMVSAALAAVPARAQQTPDPTPAAISMAKEILAAKNLATMYKELIPTMVQSIKERLVSANLTYQKDLNEVAVKIAQQLAGREQQVNEQVAKLYASKFTEAELKQLVTFYKSPLGVKVIEKEPEVFQATQTFMQTWLPKLSEEVNDKFAAEMKARGKNL